VNHYEVLGVPRGSDPAEIRRAYLRLARKHHPDLHAGETVVRRVDAQRRMLEANAAWAVLGDPERRRRYDRELEMARSQSGPSAPGATTVGADGQARVARGWAPLADDTRWMSDFEGWRNEVDDLAPDPPPGEGGRALRNPLAVLPLGVFVASVALGCVALVLHARGLLAAAYIGVALSALLFFLVPMLAMTRQRRGGD